MGSPGGNSVLRSNVESPGLTPTSRDHHYVRWFICAQVIWELDSEQNDDVREQYLQNIEQRHRLLKHPPLLVTGGHLFVKK